MHDTASSLLPFLMKEVLEHGDELGSRNGRVKELQNIHITLTNPANREILTPERHASYPAQIAETAWVLAGRDDIEWLSKYLPRAPEFSDDGVTWRGAYGPRIRQWNTHLDQVQHVIDVLRTDPTSRRAVISIYSPNVDTEPGKDIPCNNWLHFMSRLGKLDLHVAVRSNDLMWGWSGINAFEWSVLQEIIACALGLQVGTLHFSISSLHLYERHWAKAQKIADSSQPVETLNRIPFTYPLTSVKVLDNLLQDFFKVENLIRNGPTTSAAIGEITMFPEPMFRSWLRVLAAHWSGDWSVMEPLTGTTAFRALQLSPVTVTGEELVPEQLPEVRLASAFLAETIDLHNEKHAAYGDSWKRRGEMLGILANIARKVDRLGGAETADETSTDTAMDLFVYLAKYRVWLIEEFGSLEESGLSDTAEAPNQVMVDVEQRIGLDRLLVKPRGITEEYLTKTFDRLEDAVNRDDKLRYEIVDSMLSEAYRLARTLWENEKDHEELTLADEYRGADHE